MDDSTVRPNTSHYSEYSTTKLVYSICESHASFRYPHPTRLSTCNRVTKEKLEEAVAESNSNIQSKERQHQAKNQLHEKNEYILQLEEQ